MRWLAALVFASCSSTQVTETARYLAPNYMEIGVNDETNRPAGWDATTYGLTLGWYLQAVPTRPSYGRDRSGREPEPIPVIQPETQEILATLVANQASMHAIQSKTIADQFGQREAIAGGAASLLAALAMLLRYFKGGPDGGDSA